MPFRFNPCPTCCEEALCTHCDTDTWPGSITVTISNMAAGAFHPFCASDCTEWNAAWELARLTQAEVDALFIACPATITEEFPVAGCYFRITKGLPCGATAMVIEILDGGTLDGGFAYGNISVCYTGTSTTSRMAWWIATDDSDQDCLTNIDTNGGGLDNQSFAIYDGGSTLPCRFVWGSATFDMIANA